MNISVTANAVPASEASSRSRFSVRLRQASGIVRGGRSQHLWILSRGCSGFVNGSD